jgi:hypothetical protein
VVHEFDSRSLFIFDSSWTFRKAIVWFIEWKWFDRFIILVIVLNSFLLAAEDYSVRIEGPDYVSNRADELKKIDDVFTMIFIVEFLVKVIGRGFILHENAYLHDGWNWLDFFVVLVSVLGWLDFGSEGLKALRTFRILRPLRSINALPRMRALIQSLILSIPGLLNVIIFLIFVFMIFSILGAQSLQGSQYQRCRLTAEPIIERNATDHIVSYEWPIIEEIPILCRDDESCRSLIKEFAPHAGIKIAKCGASLDYGVLAGAPGFIDGADGEEFIFFDIVNFNDVFIGLASIFLVLTLEGWTTMMYNYMDSSSAPFSIFFFVTLVIFGSFFTLNLLLAVIMESFAEQQAKKEKQLQDHKLAD